MPIYLTVFFDVIGRYQGSLLLRLATKIVTGPIPQVGTTHSNSTTSIICFTISLILSTPTTARRLTQKHKYKYIITHLESVLHTDNQYQYLACPLINPRWTFMSLSPFTFTALFSSPSPHNDSKVAVSYLCTHGRIRWRLTHSATLPNTSSKSHSSHSSQCQCMR